VTAADPVVVTDVAEDSERRSPREETDLKVLVRYMCPIYAVVDLDEDAVTRVVVDDEAPSAPVEAFGLSLEALGAQDRDQALAIAESDTWPSWDCGW